jgi:hypothetical protein
VGVGAQSHGSVAVSVGSEDEEGGPKS